MTLDNGTDGQTDRQTDRQSATQYAAPSYGGGPHNKRSERRKRCSPKSFRPAADPLPGGAGPPEFNQLEMVTSCTYKTSLVKIDARNFELSW